MWLRKVCGVDFDPALMCRLLRFAFDAVNLQICVDCHGAVLQFK
jgi:hypothetical protein